MSKQYIGQKEVKTQIEEGDNIRFTLSDGSGDDVTKAQFEAIISDKPYDEGEVRTRKWDPTIVKMVAALLEGNMKRIEFNFIIQRLMTTVEDKYDKATAQLFKAKYADFVTLDQVDKVLKLDASK